LYRPDIQARKAYDELYKLYRTLAEPQGQLAVTMRRLREIATKSTSTSS
jgi:hypothetical protein